jgi:hypothetical protein
MCPKIDVMERECKKLELWRDLNKALLYTAGALYARSDEKRSLIISNKSPEDSAPLQQAALSFCFLVKRKKTLVV